MRPFLRRSGNIARLSSRHIEASLRSSTARRSPFVHVQTFAPATSRTYASQTPSDPKPPSERNEKDSENKGQVAGKGQETSKLPGETEKSAQDDSAKSQQLDSDKLEGSPDGQNPQTHPGWVPLSTEEERLLTEILEQSKERLSDENVQEVEKIIARIKKNGIPPDAREILKHYESGKLDILSSVKLFRHAFKVVSQAAKEVAEEDDGGLSKSSTEPRQKSGVHDPGPQSPKDKKSQQGKRQKKGEEQQGFNMGFKMDTSGIIIGTLVSWLLWSFLVPGEASKDITWQEFRTTFLEKGLVEKIVVLNGSRAKVYLHREAVASLYPESPAVHPNFFYYFTIGSIEAFEKRMDDAQSEMQIPSSERIPVAYQDNIPWVATILSFGPTLLFIGALVMLSRRAASGGGQNGIFGIGRSRAKRFNHEADIKVKFADVAGMDEAKQEIMEFVSYLKDPSIYQKLGAKIPRGAILSGPPGTGKTLIAKATAGESGVPFFSVSGSEFVEMFVGVGPSRVRDLFATARKNTPCIIFIDEIDAIGRARSSKNFSGGNDERESTLNQILTEMDGFNTSEQVVVIAGTNRPDILDKALLRPGRFDRHIVIDKPTMEGRKQIFAVHLKNIVTKEDMEHLKGRLSSLTPGFSGADIANCVNEAALIGKIKFKYCRQA